MAHPAFCLVDTGYFFVGGKRPEREVDHLPPSSAEVMKGGTMPPLRHTSSWRGA
jgi:hypothetical protein